MKSCTIVAHRGGKGPYKDNTLKAFQHALEQGADAIEMDMRFDHYKQRFYLEHNFLWWPRDRENTIDKIIPFLPEKTFLMIELKTNTLLRKKYALKFMEAVKKYELTHNTLIFSYNPFILLQLRKLNRHFQMGFVCPSWSRLKFFAKWVIKKLQPEVLILQRRLLKDEYIDFARSRKMKIFSYTMNTETDWVKAKDLGLDGIITDYPGEARKIMEQKTAPKIHRYR